MGYASPDGGGISGVSQLETLDALMRRMGDERDEVEPHPYDYFVSIVSVSPKL
jgi:hypothetical protein